MVVSRLTNPKGVQPPGCKRVKKGGKHSAASSAASGSEKGSQSGVAIVVEEKEEEDAVVVSSAYGKRNPPGGECGGKTGKGKAVVAPMVSSGKGWESMGKFPLMQQIIAKLVPTGIQDLELRDPVAMSLIQVFVMPESRGLFSAVRARFSEYLTFAAQLREAHQEHVQATVVPADAPFRSPAPALVLWLTIIETSSSDLDECFKNDENTSGLSAELASLRATRKEGDAVAVKECCTVIRVTKAFMPKNREKKFRLKVMALTTGELRKAGVAPRMCESSMMPQVWEQQEEELW